MLKKLGWWLSLDNPNSPFNIIILIYGVGGAFCIVCGLAAILLIGPGLDCKETKLETPKEEVECCICCDAGIE